MRRLAGFSLVVLAVLALQIFFVPRPAEAATLKTLYNFCGDIGGSRCLDGRLPSSNLVEYGGYFYGATPFGGQADNGTVFRISPSGAFKQLHAFCTVFVKCTDGRTPGNLLSLGPSGELYGVTLGGDGAGTQGTVFEISPAGQFKTLYNFCAQKNCQDGSQPVAVIADHKGNLYGTTLVGGAYREGIIFKISSTGTFTKLYDFCSTATCNDGMQPSALRLGQDGDLYGTTPQGGLHGGGTVFKITPNGKFRTIYNFCSLKNCADSAQPGAPLTEGANSIFYGVSDDRTLNNYKGAIFDVTLGGKLTVLHGFCSLDNCADGGVPGDGLAHAPNGLFYGATVTNGKFFNGLVFSITTAGKYTVVYNFCSKGGCFDGAAPQVAPIVGSDGKLYGTTANGGTHNNGTFYRLTP